MSASQNLERRCKMQSCANSLTPSLALGSGSLCQSNPASLPRHTYIDKVQTQPPAQQQTISQSPRQRRRQQKKARAKKAASQPSGQHQQQLQAGQLSQYVASAQHHGQSDAALALAQGNSQDSAALPAPAPSAALFPRVLTSSLLPAQGGVGLVEVPTQIQALQAKVVSRLLEPERLAWKVFQLHHLSDAPRTRALAYGATILFSTISIGCLQLPARLTGYVLAFRALRPHRLLKINAMPAEDVLNEPIFYNRQAHTPTDKCLGPHSCPCE
ncbi:TPA: hypothetical protein ACH3X1_012548 [Trebouxia sp. C0004]